MPLDPVLQMITENANRENPGRSIAQGTPEEGRQAYDLMAAVGGSAPELKKVEDGTIPGPAGEIPVRIYTPMADEPLPVVAFYHGGGFVIGSLESHDPLARQLAAHTPAIVVAVDYRLAPEHPFPAAVEDSWAAAVWIAENAHTFGGDPGRLAVAGDSAGGNLAALTAIRARDEGGPELAYQILIYPTVDATLSHPSIEENAAGPFLTRESMEWFFGHYVGGDADREDPRLSPIRADVSEVAPALIITAEYDPLRDEGEAYGRHLAAAGVETTVHRYDGMSHVFVQLAGVVPQGQAAIEECAAALREAFATRG